MGGSGGKAGGGGGGGGGATANVKAIEKKLKYAKDRRQSVTSYKLKVKWDKEVSRLTHKLTMARGRTGI